MCAIETLFVVRACADVRIRAMLREASINEVLMVSCRDFNFVFWF
jgi:hypothetical protein